MAKPEKHFIDHLAKVTDEGDFVELGSDDEYRKIKEEMEGSEG